MEIIIFLFAILIWIGISLIVASHAQENDHDPLIWGAVTFVLGLWGILIYAIFHLYVKQK